MTDVNERIDKLKEEASDLRKEIKDLKETLQQQNELIINLLSQQNDLLLNESKVVTPSTNIPHMLYGRNVSEIFRRFPIESIEDLEQYEKEINEENKQQNINIIQNLLSPHGLLKSLVNIISDKVIMDSNVDGHHNKKRLLNYPHFIDVLFNACYKDGFTKKEFLDQLRRALKNSKNRCHKNNCLARQRLREAAEVSQDLIKTEEIYFE